MPESHPPDAGRPVPTRTPRETVDGNETLSRDQRPPLPRIRPTTAAAEGRATVPSPTVEPVITTRPKAKARPSSSRWNRAATTTGVVELIYDQPCMATELVRAREGQDSVEIRDMGLASNEDVGHYVRRTIGEVVAIHPRRGDPLPQESENVSEYFHAAKGVFGGDLRVMPRRGGMFLSRCWEGCECFEDLPSRLEYDRIDRLMYGFNSLLRHKIGRFAYSVRFRNVSSFPTLECDEGGWVSVERDAFWQPTFANRSARGNPAEKSRRLRALMKANWAVGQRTQRFRLQFLGIKVCPLAGHIVSGEPGSSQPVSMETQIAELPSSRDTSFEDSNVYIGEDVWIRPWAVRATSGHSVDRYSAIRLEPTKIAYRPSLQVMQDLGGGFHSTSIRNIYGRHSPRRSPRDAAERPLRRFRTVGSSQPRYQVPHSQRPPNAVILVLYVPSYRCC